MPARLLWGFLLFTMAGVTAIAAVGPAPAPPRQAQEPIPILGTVGEFTLTDETGRAFHSDSLKGHPWIADFIFTSCAGQCPRMSSKMAYLQNRLPPEIRFLSISVDPERDSPKVLARYAQSYGAQEDRWHFLTGEALAIAKIVRENFRLSYAEGGPPEEPIIPPPASGPSGRADEPVESASTGGAEAGGGITHSSRFVLVDAEGNIRSYCDSTDPKAVDRLIHDAEILLELSR